MKIILIVIFIASVLLNFLLIFGVLPTKFNKETPEELQTKYYYLAKRIHVENPHDLLINFMPLRTSLRDIIQKDYDNNFSVYFEYLPTGTSIGVNEKVEFYTASLIKVPVAMAYYHHLGKSSIKQSPTFIIEEKHIGKIYGNLWKKGVGAKIPAEEAINLMLSDSDNTAYNLILDYVDAEDLNFVFEGLDVLPKDGEGSQIIMTVKSYSSVLKALYFGAIISKDDSQHILELLSKTKFNDKLAAGIPTSVPVAHKHGVFDVPTKGVFSDCGIIYIPKRPYLICMASRSDENTANERMKTVSKMVYDFVSSSKTSD